MAEKKKKLGDQKKRTKDSLGKENLGDKLPKNGPVRLERKSTAMRGTMRQKRIRNVRSS